MAQDVWLLPAEILNLSAMALVFVLGWLALARHPQIYFRWWVISAAVSVVGAGVSLVYLNAGRPPALGALIPLLMAFNAAVLVGCARRYREAPPRWPAKWWGAGAVTLASWALMAAGLPDLLFALPGILLLTASHVWFGWAFWPRQGELSSMGARLVSLSSIGWGLHMLTYPLYDRYFPGLLPLGFWLSGLLKTGLGVAMIVHLFELAHDRAEALGRQLSQTNQELMRTLSALTDSRSQAETSAAIAREQEALARQILHDLRNATQAISLISEDIEAAAGDKEKVEHGLAALDRQVRFISTFLKEKLAWIVDRSVLDEQTALPTALEATAAGFAPIVASKGQHLIFEPAPDVTLHITPIQFEQILGNMVRNAHAHCPEGTTIRVWTAVSDGWVTCYVADDGPGIPLSAQAKLGRAPARPDGTGVGLRHVHDLATAAGGLFGLVSEPERGSTFYVTLPLVSWGLAAPDAAPTAALR